MNAKHAFRLLLPGLMVVVPIGLVYQSCAVSAPRPLEVVDVDGEAADGVVEATTGSSANAVDDGGEEDAPVR